MNCQRAPSSLSLISYKTSYSYKPILIIGQSQNQKFGAPPGCLVGKYKGFGEK